MGKVFVNLGQLESKTTTFKFPYSRSKVHLEPEFIPKDKKKAELMIGMYFCQMHMLRLNYNIEGVKLNNDDSNKKGDVIITHDGKDVSMQITRLSFTDFETRKSVAKKKSIEFAKLISDRVRVDRQVVINIFPKNKHKIPLQKLGSRAKVLERKLIDLIVLSIQVNESKLKEDITHISIGIKDGALKDFFYSIDLCPVPEGMFANVHGYQNIFINYNFYGATYDKIDVDKAIDELFKKKDQGVADMLLIWANSFEMHYDLEGIVEKLRIKFATSSFGNIQFMAFHDSVALFRETLKLWGIKPLPT
jgi:hypothetical protein